MPLVNVFDESSDSTNVSTEETTSQETETTQEAQISLDEERARQGGWRPQDEWEGDPDEWVNAKEFNKRGEMMDRIRQQSKQLKGYEKKLARLEQSVNTLGEHNKKIAEIEKKKLLDDLNKQKYSAISEGDANKAAELDSLIEQVNDVDTSVSSLPDDDDSDENPALEQAKEYFISWVERPENTWYKKNPLLVAAFNQIGAALHNANPNMPINQLLDEARKQLAAEFPEKFPKKKGTSKVTDTPAETGIGRKAGKKVTLKDLPQEHQNLARDLAQRGIMTVDEWVKQYVEANPEEFN